MKSLRREKLPPPSEADLNSDESGSEDDSMSFAASGSGLSNQDMDYAPE